jgi:DNA-binding NarL/FixJ family response regulator
MKTSSTLAAARAAFEERRWADVLTLMPAAEAEMVLAVEDLERWGRAGSIQGRDDIGLAMLARCYELSRERDPGRAAHHAFWYGYRLMSLGETAQGGAWLARAAEMVAAAGGESVVTGYLNLPRIRRHLADQDYEAAAALAREAGAIGARYGDADLRALAAELEGRALISSGEVEQGLGRFDQAMLTATEGGGSELVRGLVYCSVIAGCQLVFAVDHAREWTAVLAKWCEAQPQLGIFTSTCRVHRAELMQMGGDWADALAEIAVLEASPRLGPIDRAGAAYQQAEINRARGEHAAAEAAYGRAAEAGGETQPGLALLRLAQGRIDDAAGGIRRALATTTLPLKRARYLPAAVEILVAAGAADEAIAACRELHEIAEQFGTPMLQAVAAHARGTLALQQGDAVTALPELKASQALWQQLDAPYLVARIRVEIAEACRALGDEDGARLEREAASKVFRALGARPAVTALADASDASPLLSRREHEVLQLAAAGQTNRQIAAALRLSGRTVDRHMSNILMKLAVPSRAAATAYAYEHGLVGAHRPAG